MSIYFSFSIWKISFSVSVNSSVINKKERNNYARGAAGRGFRCTESED